MTHEVTTKKPRAPGNTRIIGFTLVSLMVCIIRVLRQAVPVLLTSNCELRTFFFGGPLGQHAFERKGGKFSFVFLARTPIHPLYTVKINDFHRE